MYPESFFQWLGYIGIIFSILIIFGVIIFAVEHRFKKKDKED